MIVEVEDAVIDIFPSKRFWILDSGFLFLYLVQI